MLAYHGAIAIKQKYVARAIAHREADDYLQHYGYWKDGKGCAIGCLAEKNNEAHEFLEEDAGLPLMVSKLADAIFEGLPIEDAKKWPERFAAAPKEGADLSLVGWKFLYWNLTENLVLQDSDDTDLQKIIVQYREAIRQCSEAICPLTKGEKIDKSIVNSAENVLSAAWSAGRVALSTAWNTAWNAALNAAWSAAWNAALSAKNALSEANAALNEANAASEALSAALSAANAAWNAAWNAAERAALNTAWNTALNALSAENALSEANAESAANAALSEAWQKMADKLIQLIEEAA